MNLRIGLSVKLRTYTHEERESLAREISERILSKYGDSVLSVFICGSTSKKLDRPYSDLEMVTIVRDGLKIPTKYYLYRGIVVEIDYFQEASFLQAARRVTLNWPFEADEYRNRVTIFEREGWLGNLDRAVSSIDDAQMLEALRASAVEMVEDLCSLRNADISNDLVGVRSRGLYLAGDIGKVVLLMNRRYVLTTSWFWKQVFECPFKPERLQEFVEKMAGFVPTSGQEITQSAELLCEVLVNMVKENGVSIESDDLLI